MSKPKHPNLLVHPVRLDCLNHIDKKAHGQVTQGRDRTGMKQNNAVKAAWARAHRLQHGRKPKETWPEFVARISARRVAREQAEYERRHQLKPLTIRAVGELQPEGEVR